MSDSRILVPRVSGPGVALPIVPDKVPAREYVFVRCLKDGCGHKSWWGKGGRRRWECPRCGGMKGSVYSAQGLYALARGNR